MLKLGLTEQREKTASEPSSNLLPISAVLSMLMYLGLIFSGWLFLFVYGLSSLIFTLAVVKAERDHRMHRLDYQGP